MLAAASSRCAGQSLAQLSPLLSAIAGNLRRPHLVMDRLGVGHLPAPARQKRRDSQADRSAARPLQSTAARRPCMCLAASPRPSSRGSEPDGSGAATLEDVVSMLQKQGATLETMAEDLQAVKDQTKTMQKDVDSMEIMQNLQSLALSIMGIDIKDVKAMQAKHDELLCALAKKSVRAERLLTGEDEELRNYVEWGKVDDLIGFCSVPDQPASKELLYQRLLESTAFWSLTGVLRIILEDEAKQLGVKLSAFPKDTESPPDVKPWLVKSRKTLLKKRSEEAIDSPPFWLPASEALEAYAKAAGASDDGASLLALLESDDSLVLRLVAALATDQFWECIKLDAKPILRASSEGVELDLLEIPVWPEDVDEAEARVKNQAKIFMLAMNLCNPSLIQRGMPHVRGTLHIAVRTVK
ncbi:hypothetical protein ABPG77_006916 [Micractinium sp. CCAP 211/92]